MVWARCAFIPRSLALVFMSKTFPRAVAILFLCAVCAAQQPLPIPAPPLNPLSGISFPKGPLTIHATAVPNLPYTVTGAGGAILGQGDGTAEVWQFPVKFFSGLRVRAEVDGYPTVIDLNAAAATLDASPDHTTITYSHAAVTVRQHMFVPAGETNAGEGGVIVFEVHAIRPTTITISLTPSLVQEWPAPQFGQPGWDWQPMGTGGAYGVSTDNPELFGVIAMPGVTAGPIAPYQEHPRTQPMEFRLRYDPAKHAGQMFPLLCELARPGEKNSAAAFLALKQRVAAREDNLAKMWTDTQAYYAHFFDTRLLAHTPDAKLDQAMAWAELAIDKAKVRASTGETGLVAGWFPAFDSARPGFGWFFGRDTLWSLYAVNAYGDSALSRQAMDFLIHRQRADGKMMHEYSQTADRLTGSLLWSKLPYEYAAADSTPLYLLLMLDYVRTTGDMAYLRANWNSVKLAYHFERTQDSDGDGVYDNQSGTGWVESWPPPAPHQELYLAALDRDATTAMAQLARWMADNNLAAEADARATALRTSVEKYQQTDGRYAFSRNRDGSYDTNLTVYPAVALWGSPAGLAKPDSMLQAWSSSTMATDWGTRAVASTEKAYDANSYHQGTVWPLFTGWTSLAQYRSGRPMAGLADLQKNVSLTWAQDPGSVTELLSGRFYQPLGRSSTHQLWSSAMVIAPAVKGLFGIEPDATHHSLIVHPHLPAAWPEATLEHVRVGGDSYSVRFQRNGAALQVVATSAVATTLCLRAVDSPAAASDPDCHETPSRHHTIALPLPLMELSLEADDPVRFGDETHLPRVIAEKQDARGISLTLEAPAGSAVRLRVQRNGRARPTVSTGTLLNDVLAVTMPGTAGSGDVVFTTQTVRMTW